jgi:hypothetical protein
MHWTETALLQVMKNIYTSADAKNDINLVGLDIFTALDTICHRVLLDQLQREFGLCGSVIACLRSYLSGGRQSMKLGSRLSPVAPCPVGVPQGSVLAPLSFTIDVSPVGELIKSLGVGHHQFADDTQSHTGLSSANTVLTLEQLPACTAAIHHWFLLNYLQLNADKSENMLLGTAP